MFEQLLISHCAPTLAGIKTANLFNACHLSLARARYLATVWDARLSRFGLRVYMLCWRDKRALFYVYRPQRLALELQQPDVADFLSQYGYDVNAPETAIRHLQHRITEQQSFPHEIGLFLSYPLEDVHGFIIHKGRNYKCCGCWKVYGDECAARELFHRYEKCTDYLNQLYQNGHSMWKLIAVS